jgi:DNA-binding HxlR family transcriptional regulator
VRITRDATLHIKLEVIRGKWKPHIIYVILHRKNKFNKIKMSLGSVTSKTLSKNLSDLIDLKVLIKEKDVYMLTNTGRGIAILIEQIFALVEQLN